jgi:glycosyltransferase involved in cell wall biosynthesis
LTVDGDARQAPLRVGIDGCCFSSPKTGIGRYVYELCNELDSLLPHASFFLYSRIAPMGIAPFSARWIWRVETRRPWKALKNTLWLKLRAGSLIRHDHLDVFWSCEVLRPGFLPRETKTIVTVYDLIHEFFPRFLRFPTRCRHRLFYKHDIKQADAVTTVSKGTADKLRQLYNCSNVTIVGCALSKPFLHVDTERIRTTLSKHRIRSPYLLSVATWQPNKNLELLIKTFLSMKRDGFLGDYCLALAGPRGWKDARLADLVKGAARSDVLPLGYVAEEELAALYAGADLLVFPSFYEGFGLPVLEARACGTRVVATDIPEIREAGGGDAIYIAPNPDGIRSGLLLALEMPKTVRSERSFPTWKDSARRLAELILRLHSERRTS